MHIFICGFSGSGKSVLVNALAKKFKLKAIHSSDILKQISSGVSTNKINYKDTAMNQGWYEKSNLDNKRQDNEEIDIKLDTFLLKIINKEKNIIMDSWTMPYLSKRGLKIWLRASVRERAKRISLRNKIKFKEALKSLKKKDAFSKTHFKKIYGFSLGQDLSVFDYVINTNKKTMKDVEKEVGEIIKNYK